MKFIEILLAFLASQGKGLFQQNTEAFSEKIINNSRRIVVLLAICVISITLFCCGISLGYTAAVTNLDQGNGWVWSNAVIGGILLSAISLVGLIYSLGEDRWLNAVGRHPEDRTQKNREENAPGLESAFAVLISEVAAQLKASRKNAAKDSGDTP